MPALEEFNLNEQSLEHDEQALFFAWCRALEDRVPALKLAFAIPNGMRMAMSQAKKAKAEGLKAGIPDIFLPMPRGNYHGLFIELKRRRGGTVSKAQKECHIKLIGAGYAVAVCKGGDDAFAVALNYLGSGVISHGSVSPGSTLWKG